MSDPVNLANLRLTANLARQDYEKTVAQAADGVAGLPQVSGDTVLDWGTPAGWEQFRAMNGFYPFGWQNGSRVNPPNFNGAPDFVFEKMGLRKPPVSFQRPS